MVPERQKIDERFTISLNDVKHGIQFEKYLNRVGHNPDVPENGSRPKTNLQNDANDLAHIPDEYIEGGNGPPEPKPQYGHTKEVI